MSRKTRIGVTRNFFDKNGKLVFPGLLGLFEGLPDVEHEVFAEFLPEVTPEQIRGFDLAITRTVPRWTKRSLIGNSQLLVVLRTGVGYEGIDVPALTEAGVLVCITPAAVRRPMAVAIMTFILALSTRLFTKDRLTREGRWMELSHCHGYRLTGKTLGSIGVGNIGHELFVLAKPFGMRHIAYDPYVSSESVADVNVQLVDFDTVLAESDFLNISCPLAEKTRHLIGEKELRKMKKTAFLINTARGPIVDEAALIKALQEGWIRGAGIDVFEQEPTPPDNPLLKLDNVIVTGHSLGVTEEFLIGVWEQIRRQILQITCGEVPEGLVNREVWDKPSLKSKLERFLASKKE